jgi:hypothetical protein
MSRPQGADHPTGRGGRGWTDTPSARQSGPRRGSALGARTSYRIRFGRLREGPSNPVPRVRLVIGACTLLVALGFATCRHTPSDAARTPAAEPTTAGERSLTIAFGGSLLGLSGPNGCLTDLRGGLAPRKNALNKLAAEAAPLFVFDTGDLVSPGGEGGAPDKKTLRQARDLFAALRSAPLDAVVPGEADLALGCEELKKSAIPFVLSNQLRPEGVFPRMILVEKGTIPILVLGFLDPTLFHEAASCPGLEMTPGAFGGVRFELPKTPLTVALVHGSREFAEKITAQLPHLSPLLILAGHGGEQTAEPILIGKNLYAEAGTFYRDLLVFNLAFPPVGLGESFFDRGERESKEEELRDLAAELARPALAPAEKIHLERRAVGLKETLAKLPAAPPDSIRYRFRLLPLAAAPR